MREMNNRKKQLRIKIISLGNAEVGKSCIIKRYCEKRFVAKYLQTIGIDYGVTKVQIRNEYDVKVNIFDMSGSALFYEVRNEFYKDTQGCLLVFDVNDKQSFDALEMWIEEIRNECDRDTFDQIVFVVCGNKIDKSSNSRRVISVEDARLWSSSKGYYYFEVSASSGSGINELFDCLFNEIIKANENGGKPLPVYINLGYNKEQIDAIRRLKESKDNYERLGLRQGCTKEEINNAYKKLAFKFHPDKNVAPGSEEAFKILLNARTDLLKQFN